jgi:endonuclease/exonuclease/phosphatase family metal-dependent hydrolase
LIKFLRKIVKNFAWTCNIIVVALLLCSLAIPTLSAHSFWPIGLLSLVTPYIAGINLLFIVFWMLARKWRRMLLSVVATIVSWKVFTVACAGNFTTANDMRYASNNLKVISYNVRLLGLYSNANLQKEREDMAAFINEQNADVVCLQEFFDGDVIANTNNIEYMSQQCKLPYHAFNANIKSSRGSFGDIIFSKKPIIANITMDLATDGKRHNFHYADIVKNEDTFRIFNLHLQSYKLNAKEVQYVEDAKTATAKNTELQKGLSIVKKLKEGFTLRCTQADQVSKHVQASTYPAIVCGDFNDLPTSYAYFNIRGKLGDAFLDKSLGLGRTYNALSAALRIDYVMYNKAKLKTRGYDCPKLDFSDHYPLVVNFEVRK